MQKTAETQASAVFLCVALSSLSAARLQFDARLHEGFANFLGEFERVDIVAVNANSVGGDLDSAAVNRFDDAFLNRAHHARYCEVLSCLRGTNVPSVM